MDIAQREVSGFKTLFKKAPHKQKHLHFWFKCFLNSSLLKIYFCFQKMPKLCIKGKLLIAKGRMWCKSEPSVDYKGRRRLPAS